METYEEFRKKCNESMTLGMNALMEGTFDPYPRFFACMRLACIFARMCGLSYWHMLKTATIEWRRISIAQKSKQARP